MIFILGWQKHFSAHYKLLRKSIYCMCNLLRMVFWCYLAGILANMERQVGESDTHMPMCMFQQKHTFIICWFSFVFDRWREAGKWCRRWGFSETHSQLNMWEVCLWRKRKQMPEIVKSIRKVIPSHILMITPSKHRCDHIPTFLHCDCDCLSRQSAQEGWAVRKIVCEIRQDHPVAVGLQFLNRAFAFEFVIWRWSRDIGANDRFFVTRGPRELKGADLVGLRFKQTVHSQVFFIFSAHSDFVALCWDQQNWNKKKYKTHQLGKESNVYCNLPEKALFPRILTTQYTIYKQWFEHDEDTPIQL